MSWRLHGISQPIQVIHRRIHVHIILVLLMLLLLLHLALNQIMIRLQIILIIANHILAVIRVYSVIGKRGRRWGCWRAHFSIQPARIAINVMMMVVMRIVIMRLALYRRMLLNHVGAFRILRAIRLVVARLA